MLLDTTVPCTVKCHQNFYSMEDVAFAQCRSKALWVPLLEKAFAAYYGSYSNIESGYPFVAMLQLTAGHHESLQVHPTSRLWQRASYPIRNHGTAVQNRMDPIRHKPKGRVVSKYTTDQLFAFLREKARVNAKYHTKRYAGVGSSSMNRTTAQSAHGTWPLHTATATSYTAPSSIGSRYECGKCVLYPLINQAFAFAYSCPFQRHGTYST